MDDRKIYSFIIGGTDQSVAMWVWARKEWTAHDLPDQGFAGSLTIPKSAGPGKLTIGKAVRNGEGSKTVFRVPYTFADKSGTVEFRVVDFSVHPDRGTVDRVGNWHLKVPATQPAK